MKVAINRNHCGFAMSDDAVERCLERGMVLTAHADYAATGEVYVNPNADFVLTEDEPFRGKYDVVDKFGEDFERQEKLFRSNPVLTQVIEEMGDEASFFPGSIKLVDIPFETIDGWYIELGDEGFETIHEEHRKWPAE